MRGWFEKSINPARKWSEPIRFGWRRTVKFLRLQRLLFVRTTLWGVILAAIAHLIVAHFQLTLARPAWSLYLIAPAVPGMLLLQLLATSCVPSAVCIGDAHIGLQQGQAMWRLARERVISFRIVPASGRDGAALVLVYRTRRGHRTSISIGIARKVDLLALDQTLRRSYAAVNPGLPSVAVATSSDPACLMHAHHPRG